MIGAMDVVRRFHATHPGWSGLLLLFGDGTFKGGLHRPDGTWTHDDRGLTLAWYHWPADVLRANDDGTVFVSRGPQVLTLTALPAVPAPRESFDDAADDPLGSTVSSSPAHNERPLLNVVTVVTRPHDLPIIERHLRARLPSFRVRWYLVGDEGTSATPLGSTIECHWVRPHSVADPTRDRLETLRQIREGLVFSLDNDTTVHPGLDTALTHALRDSPDQRSYAFGQVDQTGRPVAGTQVIRRADSRPEAPEPDVAVGPAVAFAQALVPQGYDWPDWFSQKVPVLEHFLMPLQGRPARGLEVGSWEGRSARWFLEHVLTHDRARLVCVESFTGGHELSLPPERRYRNGRITGLEERLLVNLRPWLQWPQPQLEVLDQPSWMALRGLPPKTFDFVYVDGSHRTRDVLEDFVLAHRLLKRGGLLIGDDYTWALSPDRPGPAIDAYQSAYAGEIEVLYRGDCVVFRVND